MSNPSRGGGRRVRPLLLFLLWIWAGCVFLTLDLFRNVPEFDALRPRSVLYRGMRIAAHRLVGEPLPREDAPTTRGMLVVTGTIDGPYARPAARFETPDPPEPGRRALTVTGVVRDRGTERPLANVTVVFRPGGKTRTDAQGRFRVETQTGPVRIELSAPDRRTHVDEGILDETPPELDLSIPG